MSDIKKVTGYIGYARIKDDGDVLVENYKIIRCWSDLSKFYNLKVPMSAFYFPVATDKNASIMHKKRKVSNVSVEMLNFFVRDYKFEYDRCICKYPNIKLLSNGFGKENERGSERNSQYSSVFKRFVRCFDLRKSMSKIQFSNTVEKKYAFFVAAIVFYLCELSWKMNAETIDELLSDYKKIFEDNEICFSWEERYQDISGLLKKYYPKRNGGHEIEINNLIHAIDDIPDEYFSNGIIGSSGKCATASLSFEKIIVDEGKALINLINVCEEICILQKRELNAFLFLEYTDMSTGELAFVKDFFSRITATLNSLNRVSNPKSVLIVLDEPDISLHIKWTQKLVYSIITLLGNQYDEYWFQVIMTSHMPFLVTDFPRDCVVCLADQSWREEHKIDVDEYVDGLEVERGGIRGFHPKKSFMCNYYDLLREAFFIDVPVGLFAQKKYGELNGKLNGNFENGEISEKEYDELKNSIEIIDEPILRDSLNKRLMNIQTKEKRLSEIRKNIDYLKNLERELLEKND